MDPLPDRMDHRNRNSRSAASSPSPEPSWSSRRTTPYPAEPAAKRVRREEEDEYSVPGQHRGHVASHNVARDRARVHYGDTHYHGAIPSGEIPSVSEIKQIMDSLSFANGVTSRYHLESSYEHLQMAFQQTRISRLAGCRKDVYPPWLFLDPKQTMSRQVYSHEVHGQICKKIDATGYDYLLLFQRTWW